MARYVRSFIHGNAGDIHKLFQEVILLARSIPGERSTARIAERAYRDWMLDLDRLATITAADATAAIKRKLEATSRRPDTGVRPHLRDGIVCRPMVVGGPRGVAGGIPTGSVGVADLAKLEAVVNPNDPKSVPYWIVQEEGTTKNVGRTLRGFFFDRGFSNPTRPAPGYTGTPGAQPLFLPGRLGRMPRSVGGGIGPKGGKGGKGVIRNPIPARHYIGDHANPGGADEAKIRWLARIGRNELVADLALRPVVTRLRTRLRPRRR